MTVTCPVCKEPFTHYVGCNYGRKNLTCSEKCHKEQRMQRQKVRREAKRLKRLGLKAVANVKKEHQDALPLMPALAGVSKHHMGKPRRKTSNAKHVTQDKRGITAVRKPSRMLGKKKVSPARKSAGVTNHRRKTSTKGKR